MDQSIIRISIRTKIFELECSIRKRKGDGSYIRYKALAVRQKSLPAGFGRFGLCCSES
jgi:hypothetical protein